MAVGIGGCATSDYDPTANWTADQLYADAKGELDSGNWGAAVKALQKLESRYPFGRYAQQAQLDLAWASYKEGERAEALVAVDRFIRLHPTHERLDYAFYLKGLINFNNREGLIARMAGQDLSERDQQASREAYESFKQVITRFPESRYAEDSLARMKFLVNAMASGEVHIARYYYSRGAYVAAANRAQDVVSLYKQTPAMEEALNLMVISYDKLGLAELRDDALRVLERTFPQSRFLPAADARAAAAAKTPARPPATDPIRRPAPASDQCGQAAQRLLQRVRPAGTAGCSPAAACRSCGWSGARRRSPAGRDRAPSGSAGRRPASSDIAAAGSDSSPNELPPAASIARLRARRTGSSGGANGSLSMTTSDSWSPTTSTPSQKPAAPTSTAARALRNRCSSSWRGASPCVSTSRSPCRPAPAARRQ